MKFPHLLPLIPQDHAYFTRKNAPANSTIPVTHPIQVPTQPILVPQVPTQAILLPQVPAQSKFPSMPMCSPILAPINDLMPINLLPLHTPTIHLTQTSAGMEGRYQPFHQVQGRTQHDRLRSLANFLRTQTEIFIGDPKNHMGIDNYHLSEFPIRINKRDYSMILEEDRTQEEEEVLFFISTFFSLFLLKKKNFRQEEPSLVPISPT